jgi:DNA-binding PadR family transcriptional regulator
VSIDNKHSSRLSPEYVLLGFLFKNPSYGYQLHKRLQNEFGAIWHISQSQTYNILKRLQIKGDIAITSAEHERMPTRQAVQITNRGYQRFDQWLNKTTTCSVHAIRVEFITRLYFIQQYQPMKIREIIEAQVREVGRGLNQLKEIKIPDHNTFNMLALDLRIQLLQSIHSWLQECQAVLINDQSLGSLSYKNQ